MNTIDKESSIILYNVGSISDLIRVAAALFRSLQMNLFDLNLAGKTVRIL